MDNPKPASSHTETLLIVDDEPVNLRVFGELLSAYYNILVATSGARALQIATTLPAPELILLDVMMPTMDGYQVLTELQANPDTHHIPVILVTALNSYLDEERGLKLGAVDFISKPCQMSTLLVRVRTQLELKRARDWLKNQNTLLEIKIDQRQKEIQKVNLQLLQSEKLAAIGQLAAGIAHEINNPIGFVKANVHSLGLYLNDFLEIIDTYDALFNNSGVTLETLEKIHALKIQKDLAYLRADAPQLINESLDGLIRVRNIVQELKNFANIDNNAWEYTDINHSLDATLNIAQANLQRHCCIHKDYGDIPEVYCHTLQINQVFMNLLINAGQAIPEQGHITLRTGQINSEVWVEVIDNGTGIPPEHLNRLFEPFFTTRPVGKGIGIGLSIAQNIIKNHGGHIEVQSELGKGSCFRIFLPIQQNQEQV